MSSRLLIPIAASIAVHAAHAAIISVPGDAPSIQPAIDAAAAGDTIVVAAGTYTGAQNKNLDFGGKDLVLAGAGGALATVLDCEGDGAGLHLHSGETRASLITGFTITRGTGAPFGNGSSNGGGGIMLDQSSPTIRECIVEGNNVSTIGGGVFMDRGSSPLIDRCIIRNNFGAEMSGGIASGRNSTADIVDCTVSGNRAPAAGGIGIFLSEQGPRISGCEIFDNQVFAAGGGILIVGGTGTIDDCVIRNNTAGVTVEENIMGGGILVIAQASATVTHSRIEGNVSTFAGGGVAVSELSSITMSHCRIKDNHGEAFGAGLYFSMSEGAVTHTVVDGNRLDSNFGSGGGTLLAASNVAFEHCTFIGNGGGFLGADLAGDGEVSFVNSILRSTGRRLPSQFEGEKTIRYSNVLGGAAGEGNIDAEPRFESKGGFDYVLWRNSPCIDSGTGADDGLDWCAINTGYCRFNSQASDMGAYGGAGNVGWME